MGDSFADREDSMLETAMLKYAIEASKADQGASQDAGPASAAEGSIADPKRQRKTSDSGEDSHAKIVKIVLHSDVKSSPGLSIGPSLRGIHRETSDEEFGFESCIVKPEEMNVTIGDIYMSPNTGRALQDFALPLEYPDAFKYGILSRSPPPSLLLYGAPGTGKTLLIKALAQKAQSTVVSVSAADLNDCKVGVTESKIKKLFAMARQRHPCIIFIDEADAIFSSRSGENVRQGHADNLNQFLTEMDGINSNGPKRPIVVAATNRPFDIDEGILRRLGKRIFVDVPDAQARERILEIHLKGENYDIPLAELAAATHNYTGSDLKDLVFEAAMSATRRELRPARISSKSAGKLPSFCRILCKEDFMEAKKRVQPSPKADIVGKIREFHSKHGSRAQEDRSANGRITKLKGPTR